MSTMILTDNVDTFTYSGGLDLDDFPALESATGRTAGGELKTVVAGKRYQETLKLRLLSSEVQALFKLLNKPSANYFYTPKVVPAYLSTSDFPMQVLASVSSKDGVARGDEKIYFITMTIQSVAYL